MPSQLPAALAALPLALLFASPAARAETTLCTEITSLPATIGTQGNYCLKKDLATAIETGNAITIATNNVTIDCNGYKLGGLSAGSDTRANGIGAVGRLNVLVRNCNVRGFLYGIFLDEGGGHVIEDNRFDGNTYAGAAVLGADGGIFRRNYVLDSGGNLPIASFPFGAGFGIGAYGSTGVLFEDNVVVGTFATPGSNRPAVSIILSTSVGIVRDNNLGNTVADGTGVGTAIFVSGGQAVVTGNVALNSPAAAGNGIKAPVESVCSDNKLMGYTTSLISTCTDGGRNTGF